jgi:proton glutamate symport protein
LGDRVTATSRARGPQRSVGSVLILIALLAGLATGVLMQGAGEQMRSGALEVARTVGGLWLDALRMTVVPLVVTLLIVGVGKGAEAARTGRIAGRTIGWIVAVCTASAALGALATPVLTGVFPLPAASAEALRAGLAALDPATTPVRVPGAADFLRGVIPQNVIAAAAEGQVLPLVVFSLLFALAIARLDRDRQRSLLGLVQTIADALLIIVGWVLWIAPAGVFALGFVLGGSAGGAAFAGLAHYVVLVSFVGVLVMLAAYPIAIVAGRVRPGVFVRAMLAPQAVAVSTRSSLASLPAMLTAARQIGVREEVADISLPIAVALFRATGPAMNAAVVFYIAHWLGFEPAGGQVLAAIAVAAVISYGSISLPGEISFFTSIAPIAMALGVPIAPLALFVAVEMVPDIVRTLGNVSMDVAVSAAANRGGAGEDQARGSPVAGSPPGTRAIST